MYNGKFSQSNLERTPEIQPATDTAISDMPELGVATAEKPVTQTRVQRRASERERKLRKNARLFYRIYFISTAALLCLLLILMIPLRNWLVKFESTQPDQTSQQVFSTLFEEPNWGAVYDAAKMEDSAFENRDDFIAYMQAKVNTAKDKQFSFHETSSGLSKDHKYIVQLGDEKIATFTLTSSIDPKTEKTVWTMNSFALSIARSNSVSVQRLPGQIVRINGKEVSDDYIVRSVTTRAEEYLPEGVHGFSMQELQVDGLITTPTVQVLDANGNIVPTIFSVADNCYKLDMSKLVAMTDTEKDVILNAAKANALFAIRAIGTGELSKHFDSSTQIYKDICNTPTFIQSFASYNFDESVTAISDFYRYNDELFSARVKLQLDITRKNGTVKSLEMNTTYLFTKNNAGAFKVTNITNVDLQEQLEQVRLDFDCNGTIVESMMVAVDTNTITLPQPEVQPGQQFLGWATKTVGGNGQITMNILFTPGESGVVPADLKPMTLYAVFGAEEAVQ